LVSSNKTTSFSVGGSLTTGPSALVHPTKPARPEGNIIRKFDDGPEDIPRLSSISHNTIDAVCSREDSILHAGDHQRAIHGYLSMFFKASSRAISGVTPPFVAISRAALIEVQNLPICGMFGITTPFSTFS
jgi:hypothetical protein